MFGDRHSNVSSYPSLKLEGLFPSDPQWLLAWVGRVHPHYTGRQLTSGWGWLHLSVS